MDSLCQNSRLPSVTLRSALPRRLAKVQAQETELTERPIGTRRELRLLQCRYMCSSSPLTWWHWPGSHLWAPSCDPTHVTGVTPRRDALEADAMCLNGQTFGHSSNIPMRSRLEVAYAKMAAGRLEAGLLCNLPLLLLAAKATASEKELRALPVMRRILLAALLPQRCCFASMSKARLL